MKLSSSWHGPKMLQSGTLKKSKTIRQHRVNKWKIAGGFSVKFTQITNPHLSKNILLFQGFPNQDLTELCMLQRFLETLKLQQDFCQDDIFWPNFCNFLKFLHRWRMVTRQEDCRILSLQSYLKLNLISAIIMIMVIVLITMKTVLIRQWR